MPFNEFRHWWLKQASTSRSRIHRSASSVAGRLGDTNPSSASPSSGSELMWNTCLARDAEKKAQTRTSEMISPVLFTQTRRRQRAQFTRELTQTLSGQPVTELYQRSLVG